jgi:crotonobetainyl-CoA:carnitine CoA-transferase CaiB-like acyl-CoA transferase
MLPFPVRFLGETLPEPSKAPTVGEHGEAVLGNLLGYDAQRIAKLRSSGALGGV